MRARPDGFAGRSFWIVGASSGIGAALAREFSRRGAEVAISARRVDDLLDVARDEMAVVPCDVTDRTAVLAAAGEVGASVGGPDVVVWSAGYWDRFDAAAWDADAFARHVEVNLLGLNNLLAAVLPGMVRARGGHLVAIASVAGYRGLAGAEAYGATKAAQLNLLEGLRAALRRYGVRVTTVSPGFVRTPMTRDNDFPMPFIVEPEEAALAIVEGLRRRRTEIVFPLPMAILMKTARVLPVRAWAALSGRAAGRGAR
ncbi:SDR family NAD(P)-dependent oxidoreductase [Nocardioides insulae]|uniref:SDR family NAD(P)-dependent oxidoreductase n=1 Tax=Nocardioides insulae TaxID=394734 RepID=UPI0005666FE3|nr:SDR family NAD(P)-dependent oxidoreductase [Nocardioides insulae]